MKKLYTAGELAKIAGVSSRTIRFYDEKGILKPCGYSDEWYRLYDDSSVVILQQILMLKYVGFSLEEIAELIKQENKLPMKEMLEKQKELMLQKRNQIDKIIGALDKAQQNCVENNIDLNHFTDIMQLISKNEYAGQRYNVYEKYGIRQREWFAWRFDCMDLKENMTVLDVGCGHGLIWTSNWERIPAGCKIVLLDRAKNCIEYLKKYYANNCDRLAKGVTLEFIEADAEEMMYLGDGYDCILTNHFWSYIKDKETLMRKLKEALRESGTMISTISAIVEKEDVKRIVGDWVNKELLEQFGKEKELKKQALEEKFNKVFRGMEIKAFTNILEINRAEDVYWYLCGEDTNVKKQLEKKHAAFLKYLDNCLQDEKTLELRTIGNLYICRK